MSKHSIRSGASSRPERLWSASRARALELWSCARRSRCLVSSSEAFRVTVSSKRLAPASLGDRKVDRAASACGQERFVDVGLVRHLRDEDSAAELRALRLLRVPTVQGSLAPDAQPSWSDGSLRFARGARAAELRELAVHRQRSRRRPARGPGRSASGLKDPRPCPR